MSQVKNLTEGFIPKQIIKLSLPIMGTSLVQMAYNLTDMIWLGRVGSDSVAAVGAASYFTWFGVSIMLIARIGAEVGVSQSLGAENKKRAAAFALNSINLVFILALAYGLLTFLFAPQLISFFRIGDQNVCEAAISYLRIIAIGALFYYTNPTFTGIFNGTGLSKLPFRINAIGLLFNIFLDPALIYGWGFFPKLGSDGAAIATIISQAIVTLLFLNLIRKGKSPLGCFLHPWKASIDTILKIIRLGLPVALHSILFSSFAMILTRIISKWGALPIAVQSVGAQIEALSWMTANGFSTALGVFTGHNFGANNWNRIYKGFRVTIGISATIGLIVTFLFFFFGKQIFSLFIPEEEAIRLGATYLIILGISQLFMCIEITTGGAFNGIGRTFPPSLVGILLTGARIPLAILLSSPIILGMTGVWWSITISSVLKGVVLFTWFYLFIRKHPEINLNNRIREDFSHLLPSRIRQDFFVTKNNRS